MGSVSDGVALAKDAKKIVQEVKKAKEEKRKRFERDEKELKHLRSAIKKLLKLLQDPPKEAKGDELAKFQEEAIEVINERMSDPDVLAEDSGLKLMGLLGKRFELRRTLGKAQLKTVFDIGHLLPETELLSISANLERAQAVVEARTQAADYVRIGFMVADLMVKAAIAVGKAVA